MTLFSKTLFIRLSGTSFQSPQIDPEHRRPRLWTLDNPPAPPRSSQDLKDLRDSSQGDPWNSGCHLRASIDLALTYLRYLRFSDLGAKASWFANCHLLIAARWAQKNKPAQRPHPPLRR